MNGVPRWQHSCSGYFILFKLTRDSADWNCWLRADALARKHKYRFENDSDRVQLLYPASTQYTTGHCCCVYLWQTQNHHNCQLKLVQGGRSLRKPQKHIQQDCQETVWWEHDEHSNNWIDEYICSNNKASFTVTFMPGADSRNDNSYGVFQKATCGFPAKAQPQTLSWDVHCERSEIVELFMQGKKRSISQILTKPITTALWQQGKR